MLFRAGERDGGGLVELNFGGGGGIKIWRGKGGGKSTELGNFSR